MDRTTLIEPLPEPTPLLDEPPLTKRIPNFGHALIFLLFTGLLLIATQVALMAAGKSPVAMKGGTIAIEHPRLQLAAMAATYFLSLAAAWFFFAAVWHKPFLEGLRWNWADARRQASRLIPLGFLLAAMVSVASHFVATPKQLPIGGFFDSALDAWLITVFGTVVAPMFEEIAFRGFLLPAFAIAYDWLSLPRTPEARHRWQTTTDLSPLALVFAAVVSSGCFAAIHAEQVLHAWATLAILFTVSLVLTFVRVRTQSVAASTLVHGAYNFFLFGSVIIGTSGFRHLERMTQ